MIEVIVAHLGILIEAAQAGLLYGRDMAEHVLATTAVRLDETITFLRIEPLHCASRHGLTPF